MIDSVERRGLAIFDHTSKDYFRSFMIKETRRFTMEVQPKIWFAGGNSVSSQLHVQGGFHWITRAPASSVCTGPHHGKSFMTLCIKIVQISLSILWHFMLEIFLVKPERALGGGEKHSTKWISFTTPKGIKTFHCLLLRIYTYSWVLQGIQASIYFPA